MSEVLDGPEAGGLVIRGGLFRGFGYVLGTALTVVAAALLTRHLGAADFGRWVVVTSLVAIVGAVTEAGMTNLGVRDYAAAREASAQYRRLAALLGLRLALTAAGVLAAVGFAALAGYGELLVLGTALAGLGLIAQVAQATYSVPLAAGLLLGRVSALDLARQLATVVLIAAGVLAGAGLLAFLAVPLPVGLALAALTAWMVHGRMPLRPSADLAEWAALLRSTLAFALASAVGTIYIYLAVVLLSLVSTDTETGVFGAAFRVFLLLGAVPGLLVGVALPVLARAAGDDRARLRYVLQRLFEASLVLGAGATLATVLGAPVAIAVVGGAELEAATAVLRVQGIALLASFVLAPWAYALISLHMHRALLATNAAALGTSAVLVLVLAESDGARGAAWATVAGELVLAAGYLLALVRAHPDLRPSVGVAGKVALASAPAAALALIPGLPALPLTLAALAVYAAGVLALGALPDELRERLPGRGR